MKHSSIRFLLPALLAALLMGCDDDCPTCPDKEPPEEKEYHFLYSFVGDFYSSWVYTYSTKTLEVVDSTYYGTLPFNDMRFSKDGRYAFYTVSEPGAGRTWMTDYASGDTISIIEGVWAQWLQLFPDGQHLLLAGGGTYLRVLSVPALGIVYEQFDSNGWGEGGVHPELSIAYIPLPAEDSLLVLKVEESGVHEEKFVLRNIEDGPCGAIAAQVSRDGDFLILTAGDFPTGRGYTQVRSPVTLRLIAQYGKYPISRPYPHPDGRRVYFREWVRWSENNPGAIWLLDLKTSLMTRVLDGSDIVGSEWPLSGLNPGDMDFTPDGRYAIIINGGGGFAFGPVLKLDLETNEIVSTTTPALGVPRAVRINTVAY